MPKVETGAGEGDDDKDLFEDSLEDALCVFRSGGGKDADILKENEGQILFYLDLENEAIVEKSAKTSAADAEEEVQGTQHPVLLNQYPICDNHSLFLLFAEEGLPQVLSDELLMLILQVFKLTANPHLRIGYNSMGADCVANNLHTHLVFADKLFPEGKVFPIESAAKKLFMKSSLKHKKEDIQMHTVGIKIGEVVGWPVRSFVISPDLTEDGEQGLEEAQESLTHCVGVVLNHFIDKNIPHNLLITDEGMTMYVIPRKFDLIIENITFFTSFETLCGFVRCKTESSYKNMNASEFTKRVSSQVSLDEKVFGDLKKEIVDKFLGEYEGEYLE